MFPFIPLVAVTSPAYTSPVTLPVISPVILPLTLPVTLPVILPSKLPSNVVAVTIPEALRSVVPTCVRVAIPLMFSLGKLIP